MVTTAAYIRVSTLEQSDDLQVDALNAWAKAQGVALTVYRDKFSGTTMARPGWNALEADIRQGKVGALVVWKLDRLGRTAYGTIGVLDDLAARKVRFVSITEGLDLATPVGKMLATMLAGFAEFETGMRKERQAAGIAAGKCWGGSKKGWTKIRPATAKAVLDLRAAGTSIGAIAEAVHLSYPTVSKIIKQSGPGVPATTR